MNWFERHLNWTTLGISIGSVLVFLVFVRVSLGFNSIWWQSTLDLSFPCILLLALFTLAWLVFTMIGYGWILLRKNRSPAFFFFFLPAFCTILGCLIYKFFFFSNTFYYEMYRNIMGDPVESLIPIKIALLNIMIFIIGWIVLLSLKKRYQVASDNYNLSNSTMVTQNRLLNSLYSGKRFKPILFYISGSILIISIISCFFMTFGYLTFHLPKSPSPEIPEISFKYPAHHCEPIYHHVKLSNYEDNNYIFLNYIRIYNALVHRIDSDISINCFTQNDTLSELSNPKQYEDFLRQEYNNPEQYQHIVCSTTTVGGIPARQFAVSVERVYSAKIDGNDMGSHIYVYFEQEGYFWFIAYHSWNSVSTQTPAFFTHLLESFKFIDQ